VVVLTSIEDAMLPFDIAYGTELMKGLGMGVEADKDGIKELTPMYPCHFIWY